MVTLRFCTSNDAINTAIRLREGDLNATVFPFMPSHVEMVYPGGYLGAHINGGVIVRPVGYDANDPGVKEHLMQVLVPDEAAAMAYAKTLIGKPYDWTAILDFLVPANFHSPHEFICSAAMTMVLRHGKLFGQLPIPAHNISPRDLLLMLFARGLH